MRFTRLIGAAAFLADLGLRRLRRQSDAERIAT
jgi:hypothetical protein